MATYIALLRAVNVGQNVLNMGRLLQLASELGFRNVITYGQSGNLVFDATDSAAACARALEAKLDGETRFPVTVFVRTLLDLEALIARNPFRRKRTINRRRMHVTFLHAAVSKKGLKKLNAIARGENEFRLGWSEIYLHCPNNQSKGKLRDAVLEQALGVPVTTRSWSIVTNLLKMALLPRHKYRKRKQTAAGDRQ